MSMNLYIKFDGQKIDVYQTPTHITYMCLMADTGRKFEMRGKEAKRAVNCYLEYVGGLMNRSYDSEEEMNDYCDPIREHIRNIQVLMQSAKKVEAYTL